MQNLKYQICERCIMDTTASDIFFDENGICNYCTDYLSRDEIKKTSRELEELLDNIKKRKNLKYDCIVGLSEV